MLLEFIYYFLTDSVIHGAAKDIKAIIFITDTSHVGSWKTVLIKTVKQRKMLSFCNAKVNIRKHKTVLTRSLHQIIDGSLFCHQSRLSPK